MQFDNLGTVERKVLGALIILADEKKTINAPLKDLADVMGYKRTGGAMTFALAGLIGLIINLIKRREDVSASK